eukprot:TRINITY_DN2459_c3_g1_i1.p1 TRINITY_DN2459_c3_g1~~TRINITY_DN2459_c3_g1_i1.p1  ORF type:complete len:359 (+),score=85.33 TRINITY_DN2459_c3_g1_i1:42-1118(+)
MPSKRKASAVKAVKKLKEEKPTPASKAKSAKASQESSADRVPKTEEAATALLKYLRECEAKADASALLPEAGQVFLNVTLVQSLPRSTSKVRRPVELPHPIFTREDQEICFLTTNPQRTWKDKIAEANSDTLSNIKKVIDMNKLRKKFKSYELKRQLATGYHLFVADEAIMNFLPNLLGKAFFSRSKEPITINCKKFPQSLESAVKSTSYSIRDNTAVSILVGKTDFSAEEIAANTRAVIADLLKLCPSQWRDIHSLCLKGSDSPALYIYAHDFSESQANPVEGYKYPARHTLEVPALPESLKKDQSKTAKKVEVVPEEANDDNDDDDKESVFSDLSKISAMMDEEDEEIEEDEEDEE